MTWLRGLVRLFAAREQPPSPEDPGRHGVSVEARLSFDFAEGRTTVASSLAPEPLFRLPARPTGSLSSVRAGQDGRPALVLKLPMEWEGRPFALRVTWVRHGDEVGDEGLSLQRATRRRVPPADQALEFTFAAGNRQARYLVEMPEEIPVTDFCEVARQQPVFAEVPPVAQMSAFLKAILHQRRSALRTLRGLTRRCPDRALAEAVRLMEASLPETQDLAGPPVRLLAAALEARGRAVYRNTLAALCALADLTLGRLGPEEIRQVAASGDPPLASPAAVRAVAGFLGVELGPEDLPGLPEDPETGRAREALQALVPRRNALTILADLADDSGSETTRSRVSRLLEVVPPDQDLGNDELEALRHYLALKGRQVQPDTLAALCVFTDFEAGLLSVEDIDSLTPRRGFIDISLYGMLAVSAAFDAELRAFLIQEPDPSARLRALKALTELGEGLIARFRQEGTPGYYTLCLADPDLVDNVALRTDLEFTGEVLVRLPMLEHLHERDLELFHATGKPVVACFSSEDRHLQWRLLQALADRPAALDLLGTFSYVEGYSLYRFNGKVLGRLAEAEARQLLGAAQVVPAYIDARGNYHYRRVERVNSPEDLTTPPQHGLEWAGKVVQFPLVEDLPRVLREPTHQYLLGRPEDRPEEERRLDRIYSAVRDYLTESEETLTLFTGSPQYQRLTREVAGRAFAEGASMVETGVRLAFQAALQKGELQITLSVPLMDALEVEETQDLAALLVLHGYAQALGRPQEPLAEVLLERLHRLTDAPARHLRWLACRLLGTDLFADREERRLAVGYILARAMESEGPRLSRAAARSMAALALARGVPAPPLVQVRVAHPPGEAELFRLEADELRVRLAEWAHQSDSRLGQGMRAPRRAEVLAELMAGLNQSFRRDGSLARQRFLVALGSAELARLRQAALATWKTFAGSRGMLVSQLAGSAPAEQIQDDYALFTVERSGSTPLLGSPTRPLTAVVLQPGEQCGPPGPGGESEPLFSLLAESAPGLMDGSLSLCRLLEAGGQTLAVEPERHLVTVARSVDPRDVLMYDPRHHAWTPLLGSPGHRLEDLGLPPGELGEYRAMLELVGAPAAGAGAAPPPSPPGRPRDLLQLADDLAQFFNFSPERHRSALNMLVGLAPVSRLPLPEPPAPQAPSLEAVS